MQRSIHHTLLLFLLLTLSACVTGTGTGVVSGTLLFVNEQPAPADTIVTVELYSFVNPESPAQFLSRAYIPSNGSSAVPFAIAYDKSRIVPKDIYIVQAYVEQGQGRASWKTQLWNVVITQGRPMEDVILELRPN